MTPNPLDPIMCGAYGTYAKTNTKLELADWFSGLAIYLSTMCEKEEQ